MIIGISGKARSGKDRFAEYLIDVFSKEHNKEFKTTAFAHRLKQMCLEHFNLNCDQLWGNRKEEKTEFKKPAPPQGMSVEYDDGRELPLWYWTPREIMQALGSFYRSIDYDFWVRKVDEKWKYNGYPDLVITDVRYVNECEYVKRNGVLVKVVRQSADDIHGMEHESETALDSKPSEYFDIEVHNDGTLDDLYNAAIDAAKVILKFTELKEIGRIYNGNKEK
ncbi:MAG: hypothetical protein DRO67_03475 [Candidatus Asgardarchaeum californiense]|nr:MAG: hypothetical protein DRO67_03475 [Candidatus Asgardarchaeum californiense]